MIFFFVPLLPLLVISHDSATSPCRLASFFRPTMSSAALLWCMPRPLTLTATTNPSIDARLAQPSAGPCLSNRRSLFLDVICFSPDKGSTMAFLARQEPSGLNMLWCLLLAHPNQQPLSKPPLADEINGPGTTVGPIVGRHAPSASGSMANKIRLHVLQHASQPVSRPACLPKKLLLYFTSWFRSHLTSSFFNHSRSLI